MDNGNRSRYYILDEKKEAVPFYVYAEKDADVIAWAKAFELVNRRIAKEEFDGYLVSTVFLGIDHNYGWGNKPELFETMVFSEKDEDWDQYQDRCSTYEEAEAMHKRVVQMIKEGKVPE